MDVLLNTIWIILTAASRANGIYNPFGTPAELTDFTWSSWSPCGTVNCQWERNNSCANTPEPHRSCRNGYWREQYNNCRSCDLPGTWSLKQRSECQGTTCRNRIRTLTYECSDGIIQRGCEKTFTQFCNQDTECDGRWENWENVGYCIETSGVHVQIRRRFCMKLNAPSFNCAGTSNVQTRLFFCDPNASSTSTSTTTTVKSSKTEKIPSAKAPSSESNKGVPPIIHLTIPPIMSTTEKEIVQLEKQVDPSGTRGYVIVVESIIIVILVVVIIYLACIIKRKKRPKEVSVVAITNSTEPDVTYNRLSLANNHGSESEYEQMLPRLEMHRSSYSSTRPLPGTPSSLRPSKPPRRNRPLSEVHTFSKSSTDPKFLLEPPLSPYATHSAPVSPMRRERLYSNNARARYSSLQRRDNYMTPFN